MTFGARWIGWLLVMALAGCGLEPGSSWRSLDLSMEVVFDPETRIRDTGRFKTAKNYELMFNELRLSAVGMVVDVATAGGSTALFDPQAPPAGYSLCHNGHCHADSGELVDYEDIQLEMNQASGGASTVLGQVLEGYLRIDSFTERKARSWMLGVCDDSYGVCEIDPEGMIRSVGVATQSVLLDMVVFHPTKLPAEGVVLREEVLVRQVLQTALDPADGASVNRLVLEWTLGPAVWDAIEFSDLVDESDASLWDTGALTVSIGDSLSKESVVAVSFED